MYICIYIYTNRHLNTRYLEWGIHEISKNLNNNKHTTQEKTLSFEKAVRIYKKKNIYNIHIGDSQSSIYHDISFYIHDSQLMANCQCVVFIKSKEVRNIQKKQAAAAAKQNICIERV